MVLNTIVSCLFPPAWKQAHNRRRRRLRRRNNRSRFALCGFTVSQLLVSLGSDADIATDWLYYETALSKDYIPEYMKTVLLVFLGMATLIWLLEVVEARFGCNCFGGTRCLTNCQIMWLGIWLEDVPQIILTFLIEIWFARQSIDAADDGDDAAAGAGEQQQQPSFSIQGVINVATSVHDLLNKIRAICDGEVEENYGLEDDDAQQQNNRTVIVGGPDDANAKELPLVENPTGRKRRKSRNSKNKKQQQQSPTEEEGGVLTATVD